MINKTTETASRVRNLDRAGETRGQRRPALRVLLRQTTRGGSQLGQDAGRHMRFDKYITIVLSSAGMKSIIVGWCICLIITCGCATGRLRSKDLRALPFPTNCDWPGDRGLPSGFDDTGIQLRGYPVRTVQSYKLPLDLECEFTILEPMRYDGYFVIRAGPVGTANDLQPLHMIDLMVTASAGAKQIRSGLLAAQYWGVLHQGRIVCRHVGPELTIGEPNRLKIQMGLESWKVTLNGQTFIMDGVKSECNPVVFDFWNWHPSSHWLVSNVTIRPTRSGSGTGTR